MKTKYTYLVVLLFLFITGITKAQTLNAAEYFFDSDPGVGNAIALSVPLPGDSVILNPSISSIGLSPGFHTLFIRYRNTAGVWGLSEPRGFYINGVSVISPQLNAAEYFFDTDPGVGNATALAVGSSADSVLLNPTITTTSLSAGFHTLFIRYRDTQGVWGLAEGRGFYLNNTNVVSPPLNASEYFIDTDPGVGNATPLTVIPGDSILLNNIPISATGIAAGSHNLFTRFRDANGVWGLYEGRNFTICSVIPTFTLGNDTSFCSGTLVLNAGAGDSAYIWNDLSTSQMLTVNNTGNYYVTAIASAGCSSSDSINVTIIGLPATPVISQSGDTLMSSSATGNQWYLNDTTLIAGATSQNFIVTVNGNYSVVVTQGGCSSAPSADYPFLTINVASLINDNSLTIYPNPNSGIFIITQTGGKINVEIYNVVGEMIYNSSTNSMRSPADNHQSTIDIDLSRQPKGIYFVKTTDNNQIVRNQKIIIQ